MSRSDSSASNRNSATKTLQAGLTALKKGDYPAAIQHLERSAQYVEPDFDDMSETSIAVRSQVGLVTAYERQGLTQQAIALCQSLSQSSNAQVQAWANRTLAGFVQRYPDLATTTSETARSPQPDPQPPSQNPTGFVPLTVASKTQRQPRTAAQIQPKQPTSASTPTSSDTLPLPGETSVDLPPLDSPTETVAPPLNPEAPRTWRQAPRAQKWSPLARLKLWPYRLLQVGTAIAFAWFCRWLLQFLLRSFNEALVKLPWLEPIQFLYRDSSAFVFTVLGVALVALPWLMDALLQRIYGLQPLPSATLANYSPEATRVLSRLCRQKNLPVPTLKILPIAAPLIFTYGVLPRTARIAVSQGLLEQLADDEIAALVTAEITHLAQWDAAVLSWAVLVLQIPYGLYWQLAAGADWLDRKRQRLKHKPIAFYPLTGVLHIAAVGAAISYGIYWLLRWPLLWLSRQRLYYSDRLSSEFTGNPNGLTRALLKIAIATAATIQQQGKVSYGLEGLSLLTPLSYQTALSVGSAYPTVAFESLLEWDRVNPYRSFLSLNQSHPLLGDRLQRLALYARHWRLETELDGSNLGKKPPTLTPWQWSQRYGPRLLHQASPYLGGVFGLLLGLGIWLLGGLFNLLGAWNLFWVIGDRAILLSCICFGISLGIFLRINRFFPDITTMALRKTPTLSQLLSDPNLIPLDSQPIQLQGQLLGRPGVANWLGQDLILQTETGLVKLHHTSRLGPLGCLLPQALHPNHLVQQPVTVKGWWHRGATAWIDLETLRTPGGKTLTSGHPIWAIAIAAVALAAGTYILIFVGGY